MSNPEKIKVLICTGNLGNKQPNQSSLNAWIPEDGLVALSIKSYSNPQNGSPESRPLNPATMFSSDGNLSSDEQYDIIAIGMQEATFEVDQDDDNEVVVKRRRKLTNSLRAARTVNGLRVKKNHTESALKMSQMKSMRLDFNNSVDSLGFGDLGEGERQSLSSSAINVAEEEERVRQDDTYVLHEMLHDHLPSYKLAISYQRGQMRLLLFYIGRGLTLDVLSIKAQNTGRAGLANKGGIVTEVNVNSSTRIAFLTAHLEAHEGLTKYKNRCSTACEIFRGTTSTATSCDCDIANANHFVFAMGDLNFRTRIPGIPPGSEEHLKAAHQLAKSKDWPSLNEYDELGMALREKKCFAGFQTPRCHFPPTFKLQRRAGYCYDKARSPSYTDRILYKAGHRLWQNVKVLDYRPIHAFTTSDHKPMRGAFEVELNLKLKERLSLANSHQKILHIYVSSMSCDLNKEFFKENRKPSPYICFASTPREAIKKDVSRWEKFWKVVISKRRLNKSLQGQKPAARLEWPKTSIVRRNFNPTWNNEKVHFRVRTQYKNGSPIDLTGAMMHLIVFDHRNESRIGLFSLNLADMVVRSRKPDPKAPVTPSYPKTGLAADAMKKMRAAVKAHLFGLRLANAQKDENADASSRDPSVANEKRKSDYESAISKLKSAVRAHMFVSRLAHSQDQDAESFVSSNSEQEPSRSKMEECPEGYRDKNDEGSISGANEGTPVTLTNGPSDSLRNAVNSPWYKPMSKRNLGLGARQRSTGSIVSGTDESVRGLKRWNSAVSNNKLEPLNIRNFRLDEPIVKFGREVGRIRCSIDCWWLDDNNDEDDDDSSDSDSDSSSDDDGDGRELADSKASF